MAKGAISGEALRGMIEGELADLVALRHELHAHPELGYEERETSGRMQRELERAGLEFKAGLAGGTGIVAHLPGAGEKAIGLRADMDALPIAEETGLEYASENEGVMHACGHDGHMTMLVGAARVLGAIAKEGALPRPVTFVFQPAEEGGAGGKRMVEDGCLDGSVLGRPVEQMFGLHGWPLLELGKVGTRRGPLLAAADMFRVTITGVGTHAAFPHLGNDAIVCGSAIVSALQTFASRNVDPLDSAVVSTTQFHAGTTHNIIQPTAELHGTVRTLRPETQELAMARLREIVELTAKAHRCEAELEYIVAYPATINAPEAVEAFNGAAADAVGRENVVEIADPCMGGEDFAFYCRAVPSCFFFLGMTPAGQGYPDLHQPTYNFNDDALAMGIEVFCRLALRE